MRIRVCPLVGAQRILSALVVTFALVSSANGNAQDTGGAISISLERARLSQQEPVLANVTVNNTAAKTVGLDLGSNGEGNVSIWVTRPDGRVSQKAKIHPKEGLSFFGKVNLAPGQSYVETLVLNDWFQFGEIGEYEIRMEIESPLVIDGRNVTTKMFYLALEITPDNPDELKSTCQDLLLRMQRNKSAQDSLAAARALSYVQDPIVIPYWKQVLERPDYSHVAASSLARIGTRDAVMSLISGLHAQDGEIRASVRSALQSIAATSSDASLRIKIEGVLKGTQPQ